MPSPPYLGGASRARARSFLAGIIAKCAEGGYITGARTRVSKVAPVTGNAYIEETETVVGCPNVALGV